MRKQALKLGVLSDYRAVCYGFCAVWIVLFHARNVGCDFSFGIQGLSGINAVLSLGNYGVDIFLLLSGVSCYFSWCRRRDSGLFLKRRLMRIVPAVLLICGSFWAIWVLVGEMHWTRLLYNATLVLPIFSDGSQGIWYVAAILMLYAAYPYIHAVIYGIEEGYSERHMLSRTIMLCVSVLFSFWMLHKYNPSLFKNIEIMVARIPTFCIGAYLGHFVKERKVFGSSAWLCVMIASAVYSIYAVLALHRVEHSYWWWRVTMIPGGVIGSLLVCGMFSLLDGICFVKPIMAFFRMTGGFSLELYVAHIMCFWSRGLIPPIGDSVATSLVLSCLSWVIAYLANRALYVWFDGGVVSLLGKNRRPA